MYYFGLDGGGTKTEAVILSENMTELKRFRSGAINFNGESAENVRANIKELFAMAADYMPLSECRRVCIGMAGISNPDAVKGMTEAVRAAGWEGDLILKGDQVTGLYGALEGQPGVTLIAGTGSICVGMDSKGELHRTGGYGNIIDDAGSGYAIGRDILSAVVRDYDGRGRATMLTKLVREHLSKLVPDAGDDFIPQLIKFLYDKRTSKKDVAGFGALITDGIRMNDSVSLMIADNAVNELFLLAATCLQGVNEVDPGTVRIAFSGSVVQKCDYIREELTERLLGIFPDIDCVFPLHDAAYGAGLIAKAADNN